MSSDNAAALPDQTVPRASARMSRPSVDEAIALASHDAGANSTRPASTPTMPPATAQRTAAPRACTQACSARVDSLQPVEATVGDQSWRSRFLRIMGCRPG